MVYTEVPLHTWAQATPQPERKLPLHQVLSGDPRLQTTGKQHEKHCKLRHSTLSIWAESHPSSDPLPQWATAHGTKLFECLSVFFTQQMLAFTQGGGMQIKPSR